MSSHERGELQSKLTLRRINQTEKNFNLLYDGARSLAQKENKVRDKIDNIAKIFKQISDNEQHNNSTAKTLETIANNVTYLADHHTLKIQRIEENFLQDLMQYQIICRNVKEEIKNQISIRDRELIKRKQLDVPRQMENENKVMISNMQISKALKEIVFISEQFEAQKITDFKNILKNFILIEMKYHTSCLEVLSILHNNVETFNERQDNEHFKKQFQQNDRISPPFILSKIKSQSLGALSSILNRKAFREKPLSKRHLKLFSQSLVSLNSLDNNSENEVRKDSHPQIINLNESIDGNKSSDSEVTDSTENPKKDIDSNHDGIHKQFNFLE
ncbi:CLUMA_CG000080, isoform A [Clunio marinus]|uniref:CLUMA_CG000080, isoform A n=1 Tax=Clunio marinus TaxID=568069 RepID=A0A1J1HEX5_9DIPT|nr:CLUMA_CG000080, isoform A [Clunio marinus]